MSITDLAVALVDFFKERDMKRLMTRPHGVAGESEAHVPDCVVFLAILKLGYMLGGDSPTLT